MKAGNSKTNDRSMTEKELAEFTAKIRRHMETNRFPIWPEDQQFRKLWQDRSKNLVVQDLEFIGLIAFGPKAIVEICWAWYDIKANEWTTLQTSINHGVSVQRLYNIYSINSFSSDIKR